MGIRSDFLLISLILAGGGIFPERPIFRLSGQTGNLCDFCLLVSAFGDDFVFRKVGASAIAYAFEMDSCNLTISVWQLSAVHTRFSIFLEI